MKTASLLLALPLVGCGVVDVIEMPSGEGEQTKGTGKPVVEARKAQAATAAEFSGALQVEILKGAPTLKIEAQKEVLPHIKSEFKNGRLRVWTEGSVSADGPMRVRFTTPSVSKIEASGATTVRASGLSGSTARFGLSGASKVWAEGKVDRVEVDLSGASEASLKGLEAATVRVEASGASKAWVTARKGVEAVASGASEVRYYGNPKGHRAEASGASSVGPG